MQNYRTKQALLMVLVFACIVLAMLAGSALLAVGAIMAACGICFWASTMEPEKAPEEHHHH
jgi:hypothetical protein